MQEEQGQPVQEGQPSTGHGAPKALMHTYAEDMARAMDATDATVVQQILTQGREREAEVLEDAQRERARKWYKTGALILIICTLGAGSYSAYHYTRLTVPVEKAASVGVFPSTAAINAKAITIEGAIEALRSDSTVEVGRPYLVPLVSDTSTLTLLSNAELFSFFGARPSEPFLASFTLLRYGIMDTGIVRTPFIIGLTGDPEISAKELLIAEPDLLQMLYKPLDISLEGHSTEIGKAFAGEYLYNIPVRTLRYDSETEKNSLLLFYARVTDTIVLFTTDPSVLKGVYDSLIRQR